MSRIPIVPSVLMLTAKDGEYDQADAFDLARAGARLDRATAATFDLDVLQAMVVGRPVGDS